MGGAVGGCALGGGGMVSVLMRVGLVMEWVGGGVGRVGRRWIWLLCM